jgi:hypothetical protein
VSPTSSCPRRTNQWLLSHKNRVSQSKTLWKLRGLFSCQKILGASRPYLPLELIYLRFRQVIVNIVLPLISLTRSSMIFARGGDRAFGDRRRSQSRSQATIVNGTIMQASDVSHTMQHWHVYRKWNYKLFMRCSRPINNKAAWVDPSTFSWPRVVGF